MKVSLATISTRAPENFDKEDTKKKTTKLLEELNDLQNLLYASNKNALLVIMQGMDASGKDGLIRNVFTSINPQGVSVTSFKAPTALELSHDFLWRIHVNAPTLGMIKIFNRSHYEDVLITRVHNWVDDDTARKRMKAINDFEALLQDHNNTTILKFYLHISREEQKERLVERISDPKKHWKYNEKDLQEAEFWDKYRNAYEDCFEHCNETPWTIVPADQNWYKEYVVAKAVHDALTAMKMQYPGLPG